MRIYFNKTYWKLFGFAAVVLALIIGVVLVYEQLNSHKPTRVANAYGGQNIQVVKKGGSVDFPEEVPAGFVPVSEGLRVDEIWVDTDASGGINNLTVTGYAAQSADEVLKTYQNLLPDGQSVNTAGNTNTIAVICQDMDTTVYIEKTPNEKQETEVRVRMKVLE